MEREAIKTMRRAEREIKDTKAIRAIMEEARVCRIGLSDGGMPYIVPMNFGLGENCIYLHCAAQGRKLDIIRRNDRVCSEVDLFREVILGQSACGCSCRYESVIGFGRAAIVEEPDEKRTALDRIMEHYDVQGKVIYPDDILEKTTVIRIAIESLTAKRRE
ncbi:MAG: pyridoxamine 5'-phosphate oxidase family protein [Proteobacteria bacterium]|nr:pyridoxamine 5'-phosphate oxidase family protein [Pseudomonadota bacterium]